MSTSIIEPARTFTVDELATEVGLPVRTIRFYAGKKLIPPPRLEGRTGLYGDVHLARLELVRDLQDHGYTLAAVEGFLERLPADADVDEIRMFRVLVAPWSPDVVRLTHAQVIERLGREPAAEEWAFLGADGDDDDQITVSLAGLELIRDIESSAMPPEMVRRSREAVHAHVSTLARELQELFRETVLRPYYAGDRTPEDRDRLEKVAAQVRQLTSQSLVVGFQHAIDDLIRESVIRDREPREPGESRRPRAMGDD